MASMSKEPLPQGFAQWTVEEKIAYIGRLWDVVHAQHEIDELPATRWQIEAAQEALREHREDPSSARPAREVQAQMREMVAQGSM